MNIEQMKRAKEELRVGLLALLRGFEDATGLEVHGVEVMVRGMRMVGEMSRQVVGDVDIDIRL